MSRSKLMHFAYIFCLILGLAYYSRPTTPVFKLSYVSPAKASVNSPVGKPIRFTFTHTIDDNKPYTSINISPKIDGAAVVNGNWIEFKPASLLVGQTKYTVTIVGAKSVSGKVLQDTNTSFTTGDQVLSDFEKSLPYTTDGYTIDRLRDGTITVFILSAPAETYKQEALKLLRSNGIDTSKVLVQNTASSAD